MLNTLKLLQRPSQNPYVCSPSLLNSIRKTSLRQRNQRDSTYYAISVAVLAVGATFAAIPLYRIFCEKTSYGGLTQVNFLSYTSMHNYYWHLFNMIGFNGATVKLIGNKKREENTVGFITDKSQISFV